MLDDIEEPQPKRCRLNDEEVSQVEKMAKENKSICEIIAALKETYPSSRHHNFNAIFIGKKVDRHRAAMVIAARKEEELKRQQDAAMEAQRIRQAARDQLNIRFHEIEETMGQAADAQFSDDDKFETAYVLCWNLLVDFELQCDEVGECQDIKQNSFNLKQSLALMDSDHPLADKFYKEISMGSPLEESRSYGLSTTQNSSQTVRTPSTRSSTFNESRNITNKMVVDSLYSRSRGLYNKVSEYSTLIDNHVKLNNKERIVDEPVVNSAEESATKEALDLEVESALSALSTAIKKRQRIYPYKENSSDTVGFAVFSPDGYNRPRALCHNLNRDGKSLVNKFVSCFDLGFKHSQNITES